VVNFYSNINYWINKYNNSNLPKTRKSPRGITKAISLNTKHVEYTQQHIAGGHGFAFKGKVPVTF